MKQPSFVNVLLLGSKSEMFRDGRVCNKCKQGIAQEADTWCVGCAALEVAQNQLKGRWQSTAVRALSEEVCLNSARQLKALWNLDRSLATQQAQQLRANQSTAAKSKPEPSRTRSPRRKSPLRSAVPALTPAPRERSSGHREAPQPTGESYDTTEEEEEKEEVAESRTHTAAHTDKAPAVPEPAEPPRSHRHSERPKEGERRKEKKTRRGGAKHQRHSRGITEPYRQTHRTLRADQLHLARSLNEGLERRK